MKFKKLLLGILVATFFFTSSGLAFATTKFLEPGGDADFTPGTNGAVTGFWTAVTGAAVATDFVHGTHIKSTKFRANNGDEVGSPVGSIADTGSRISFWIYLAALPAATAKIAYTHSSTVGVTHFIKISTGGILSVTNFSGTVLGTGTTALSTGQWYRIGFSYTAASTISNETRVYLNGVSEISITNGTLVGVSTDQFDIGNVGVDTALDFRTSDIYIDDSNALTDPGNIWVTAKRPNADGTAIEFTTRIGAGGSGYGAGHSPQVNERPWSQTNGWSLSNTTLKTEEYTLESVSQGDIDITGATIVDFQGWITSSVNSTANSPVHKIIVAGTSTSITEGTGAQLFTKFAASSTYPSTGAAIGVSGQYTTTAHLTRLFDAGVLVAYIPVPATSIKTVLGLAKASVKTILGLPIGSVKTFNGLP